MGKRFLIASIGDEVLFEVEIEPGSALEKYTNTVEDLGFWDIQVIEVNPTEDVKDFERGNSNVH